MMNVSRHQFFIELTLDSANFYLICLLLKPVNFFMNELNIFDACRRGDVKTVENLFNQDASVINAVDIKGYTPLILAVYNNYPQLVDLLLQKGADPDVQDGMGNTALMGVCFRGYKDIAEKLINAGADVNARNGSGATALTFAATFGHLHIAEVLLQNGADIRLTDERGKTPFDHARIQENEEMMELIQKYPPNN